MSCITQDWPSVSIFHPHARPHGPRQMFRPLVPALRPSLELGLIQASLKVLSSAGLFCTPPSSPHWEPESPVSPQIDVSWPGNYCQERSVKIRSLLES